MRKSISLPRPRLWRTRAATALAAAGALVTGSGFVMLAATPAGATNGNNGTVKINGLHDLKDGDREDNQDNEPFVDCTFEIQWYNYTVPEETEDGDGDVDYTVDFQLISPTSEGRSFTTDPDDSGAFVPTAADNDKDFSREYQLAISGPPHKEGAKQGYHVKVVVNTQYSQGNDVKHKVFWYKPCPPQSTQSSSDEFRQTCAGGVEKRTTTVVKEYVWDDELGWVLEPEADWQTTVGSWTFVRALTADERARLGCDQPGPVTENISDSEASCELGYRSRTGTVTKEYVWNGTSWVLEPSSGWTTSWGAWSAYRPLTEAEFEQLGCRPDQPSPDVVALADERVSCEDGLEERSGTQTTTYVWNDETRAYDAVVGPEVWGEWEFVRAVNAEEALELECVLGEETIVPSPKPDDEPTVKGVERVVPTAVAAGVGEAAPASSPLQTLAQLLVAGGLLLLVAGGWVGLGRRETGAHQG